MGATYAVLDQARGMLAEARREPTAADRFSLAHRAALRTTAAVFAERGRPSRRRLVSAWVLLDTVAPEFATWSAYFASTAQTRVAVEAGATSAVSQSDADEQLRAAEEFLAQVEDSVELLVAPKAS